MLRSDALRTLGFTSRQPASSNANTGPQSPRCCRAKACSVSNKAVDACLLINSGGGLFPSGWIVAAKDNGSYEVMGSGGSDGATMRFEPERSDGANAGLFIIHDLLLQVKSALGSALGAG